MNFSASALFAGFVFGVFGFSYFKLGRKKGLLPPVLIGLAMMLYPYFIENEYLLWGIGTVLLVVGYRSLK